METVKKKSTLWPPMKRILHENRTHARWLAAMLAAASLDAVGQIVMAWVFGRIVDNTLVKNMEGFSRYFLAIGILTVAILLITALASYSSGRYAALSARTLREKLSLKFTRLTMPWIEKRRTGDLLSLLGNDLGQLNGFYQDQLRWIISDCVRFVLSLSFMIYLNPWLTLATVAYIPIGTALSMLSSKPVQRLAEEQNEKLGVANAVAQDAVSGHSEVKAFGMGPWINRRFAGAIKNWLGAGLKSTNAQLAVDAAGIVNLVVPYLLLTVVGVTMIMKGGLTGGGLLAFIMVTNGVMSPLMTMNWRLGELRRAAGAAGRLIEALDAPEERAGGTAHEIDAESPLLSFRDIRFCYTRDNGDGTFSSQQVFSGLNLDIRRGETVAVVGQSGSGKSTLIKMAAGLYEPDGGEVRFGGHAVGQWDLKALRGHMAMVDQDTYLFPGSIRENVACGALGDRAGAPEEAVRDALRMAQLDEFISSLPEGMEAAVGERGGKLSGGQRQRVAIARSALRDAEFLLLDEPTSALDTATENGILKELYELISGRTALIVTHRLSMALYADRIVVLDAGRVAEEGTHEELMARQGLYYALYSKQVETEEVKTA